MVPDRSLGFSKGRPVAAILIARCLHQWGALGVSAAGPDDDASALLRRFSDLLARQLQLEDEAALAAAAEQLRAQSAYWLSVTAGLMVLIIRMAMHAAAGNGGAEGRGLGVKRSVAQLQRRLADRVGELHLGTRLNDGLHQLLWARSKGKGPTPAAEASAGPAAAASNEGAATTAAEYAGQGDGGSGNGGDSDVPPAAAAAASEASVYREPHPSATSASSVLSTASTPVPASPAAAAQPKLLPPASIMHQLSGIRAAGGGGAGAGSSGVPDQLAEFIVALDAILQVCCRAHDGQSRFRCQVMYFELRAYPRHQDCTSPLPCCQFHALIHRLCTAHSPPCTPCSASMLSHPAGACCAAFLPGNHLKTRAYHRSPLYKSLSIIKHSQRDHLHHSLLPMPICHPSLPALANPAFRPCHPPYPYPCSVHSRPSGTSCAAASCRCWPTACSSQTAAPATAVGARKLPQQQLPVATKMLTWTLTGTGLRLCAC